MRSIAKKGAIAKAICNYLLYVENNPKKVFIININNNKKIIIFFILKGFRISCRSYIIQ